MLSMASLAFFMGNIWNTCHRSDHTSSRQGTAAWISRSRRRTESESRISLVPAWIRVGGEVGKVPEQGGQAGVGQVLAPGVGVPHSVDIVQGEHRVNGLPLLVGFPAGRHIRPGGEEDQGPGQPPAGLFQQMGEHQARLPPAESPATTTSRAP